MGITILRATVSLHSFWAPFFTAAVPTSPTSTWLETAAPTGGAMGQGGISQPCPYPSPADSWGLHRKGREAPPAFKQFFSSAYTLSHVSLSATRLPLEALRLGG